MAAEHGDEARRGFWSSWPQAGVPLGNLLATGVLFVLAAVQSDADFEAWGWRIPFLLSAVLVLIGLYVRLQLEESPVFSEAKAEIAEKKQESSHLPLLEVIKTYPKEVLIAMGMRMAENISYYIFTIVVLTYVTTYLEADTDLILQMLLIAAAGQFFLIPAIGALSDKVGRRPLYLTGAVGVAVWSFFFFDLVKTQESGPVLLAVAVGLFFHSLMYAPQAAFFSELFGTSVRYTGASVGYQLASIFAGAHGADHRPEAPRHAGGVEHHRGGDLREHRRGDHDHRGPVRQGDPQHLAEARPRRPRRTRLSHPGPAPQR